MIQSLIKNILRKVENYPTYGIPNILREVGNIKNMIKKGRKSSQCPRGYLEFTYILRDVGNPSKNWFTIYLIYIKKGRKYQCIRRVGNYPNSYFEFTNILRDVGNLNKN